MAHPDDAEIWAGGTIALHAAASRATIIVSTKDATRGAEALSGASKLGAECIVVSAHSRDHIVEAIRAHSPDVVITHRTDDVHPDHRACAAEVLAALPTAVISIRKPLSAYTCDTYESLTLTGPTPGRFIVDVSSTFEKKIEAIREHSSQPVDDFCGMAKRIGALWGARIGADWAEAFDPIPLLGRLPGLPHL